MIEQEVAPGRKRKVYDVLTESEKKKTRTKVLYRDAHRKDPCDTMQMDKELVEELANNPKYEHMSKETIMAEIQNIRSENKPDPQVQLVKLKERLKSVRTALKNKNHNKEAFDSLQREKEDLEAEVSALRKDVDILNDMSEIFQQKVDQLTNEYAKLKDDFEKAHEQKRALEAKLQVAETDLDEAKRNGADANKLERKRDELKAQLLKVKE